MATAPIIQRAQMIPRRILLVRNDKLGDFMLAWPALRLLKETLPETEIHVLVPAYTRSMAEICPWIDAVAVDPQSRGVAGVLSLARLLARGRFDAVITLFSTSRVALAAWWARIPVRVAPATKVAQMFYNRRLVQRRSRSEKPEFAYNADLVSHYLRDLGITPGEIAPGPYLQFPQAQLAPLAGELRGSLGLTAQLPLIFVHPGTGGSANNLTIEQYARLCQALRSKHGHGFVITAGPGEEQRASELADSLGDIASVILPPKPLPVLSRYLQCADLFISGSTGPFHIAGALNRPTATFYPGHRSGNALRWQSLNSRQNALAFSPPPDGPTEMVARIDVEAAAQKISNLFLERD